MAPRKNFPVAVRKQAILDLLTPDGVTTKQITAALGYTTRSKPMALMRELVNEGKAFGYTGASNEDRRFFPTMEDRNAFAIYDGTKRAEIHRQQAAKASQRYREGSGIPRRKFAPKDPGKAPDVSGVIARLKVETKALGAIPKRLGTTTVHGPKPTGPARVKGEPDLTHAKVTVCPGFNADRWDTSKAQPLFTDKRYALPVSAWAAAVAKGR
jgi:hypothetical protein